MSFSLLWPPRAPTCIRACVFASCHMCVRVSTYNRSLYLTTMVCDVIALGAVY